MSNYTTLDDNTRFNILQDLYRIDGFKKGVEDALLRKILLSVAQMSNDIYSLPPNLSLPANHTYLIPKPTAENNKSFSAFFPLALLIN